MLRFRTVRWFSLAMIPLLLGAVLGCGSKGPVTHRVKGKLELEGNPPEVLAGAIVEASLVSQPQVRAFGSLQPDGTFELETLHDGVIRRGALEGVYNARIVLPDDDADVRKRAAEAVAPRYLQFEKSGLTIDVPAQASLVTLPVTRR